jgi:hypothetical protein
MSVENAEKLVVTGIEEIGEVNRSILVFFWFVVFSASLSEKLNLRSGVVIGQFWNLVIEHLGERMEVILY